MITDLYKFTRQFEKLFKTVKIGVPASRTENDTEYTAVCSAGVKEEGAETLWYDTAIEATENWYESVQTFAYNNAVFNLHPGDACLVWRQQPELHNEKGKWCVYSRFAIE